jgi:hypothetical protein
VEISVPAKKKPGDQCVDAERHTSLTVGLVWLRLQIQLASCHVQKIRKIKFHYNIEMLTEVLLKPWIRKKNCPVLRKPDQKPYTTRSRLADL